MLDKNILIEKLCSELRHFRKLWKKSVSKIILHVILSNYFQKKKKNVILKKSFPRNFSYWTTFSLFLKDFQKIHFIPFISKV